MEQVKRLGRGLEEISNQLLTKHEEKAATAANYQQEFDQLNKRLERLEYLIAGKHLHLCKTKEVEEPAEYFDYEKYVNHFKTNMVRDYVACAVIDSSGLPLCFHSNDDKLNEQVLSAYLIEYLVSINDISDKINLGAVKYSMVATLNYYLFIQSLPRDNNFLLCLVIKQGGNIGLARHLLSILQETW